MPKKNDWALVPDGPDDLAPVAPPVPGKNATPEEIEVYEKWRLNRFTEAAKADETYGAQQLVKRLNRETTVDGVETIEFYTDLKNEDREPDAQPVVHDYLKSRMSHDLK